MYSYFGAGGGVGAGGAGIGGMGSQGLYSSHSHSHHSHGFPEPMVMAYPCDDGFFFAVCEAPTGSAAGPYGPASHKNGGGCCSTDRRIKPNYFRHFPTTTRPITAPDTGLPTGTQEITEIGSGSTCQDMCFRSFRMLMFVWACVGFVTFLLTLGLGLYYWSGIDESVIKSSAFLTILLDYGPLVSFFVSLVLLLIPALGFFGSYKENTWLLITFAVLMFLNSAGKALFAPRNHFIGFAITLIILLIPFGLALSVNKRMSRAI